MKIRKPIRPWFYFTDSESHAKQYGNAKVFYLNITSPVSKSDTTITKAQMRKFRKAVAANEDDFSSENYGWDATVDSVLTAVYGKSDFAMLYDVSQAAIGDMVAAVELFNEVNGTHFDGLLLRDGTMIHFEIVSSKKMSLNLQTMYMDSVSYQKRKSA